MAKHTFFSQRWCSFYHTRMPFGSQPDLIEEAMHKRRWIYTNHTEYLLQIETALLL